MANLSIHGVEVIIQNHVIISLVSAFIIGGILL